MTADHDDGVGVGGGFEAGTAAGAGSPFEGFYGDEADDPFGGAGQGAGGGDGEGAGAGRGGDDEPDVPPDIAAQLVRALDRSPSTFTVLVGRDLRTRWMSSSSSWVSGTDPASRQGRESLEKVHPDDIPRLLHAFEQLEEAVSRAPGDDGIPIFEPLRYRLGTPEHGYVIREAIVNNLLHDEVVDGLLLMIRPVGGVLDGVGFVLDLLVNDAPLPRVLGACGSLVPPYVGTAAVIALVDGAEVVGVLPESEAAGLCDDPRWWRPTLEDGKPRTQLDFADFADDLAEQGRAAGFRSAWILPLHDRGTQEVIGCVAVWLRIDAEPSIGTDHSLLQPQRLASLVIGEQRRHHALRREAVTDPLTGVGNRSALRRRLDAATGPLTVGFVDLDDFKAVNDTYGHDAGDTVLREVASRLSTSVREDDLVVRIGGDEFAVVFADGALPGAVDHLVRRILGAIEVPIELPSGTTITVGGTVGVATGPPGEVVHRADDALYAVKRRKGKLKPSAIRPPAPPTA